VLFLSRTDAFGDGLDGFVRLPLLAFAGVVAMSVLKLEKKSGHAQRAKRSGKRLVAGSSQFGGIEEFSFHQLPFV
jgi:hypothetical protein